MSQGQENSLLRACKMSISENWLDTDKVIPKEKFMVVNA